jgi:hypothetical protein
MLLGLLSKRCEISNIAIDFAETSLMLKKYVEVYLSIIKPTVK